MPRPHLGLLLVAFVALFPSGRALAGEPGKQLVVLGLRPTASAEGPTEIRRLAEAQESRSLVESIVELVSGYPVVGHEDLSKLLGSAYMVDLFDCGEKLGCIVSHLEPLRSAGYRTAVYGDYWVDHDTYHYDIFTFSLLTAKVLKRSAFELTSDQLEDAAAWRTKLDPLFTNRGRVILVSNAKGYECRVDGQPCDLEPDGRTLVLLAGEHALELTKVGYKPAGRIVNVTEGGQQQIAFVLEQLPLLAPAAASRLGLEGAVPTSTQPGLTAVGLIAIDAVVEPYDDSDYIDIASPPPGTRRLWHVGLVDFPSYVGANFNDTKRGNWQFSAFTFIGLLGNHTFVMPLVGVKLQDQGEGLTIQIGRMYVPTVEVTQPGVLASATYGFGPLIYNFDGAKVSKSFGHFIADIGIGRPEKLTENAVPPLSQGFDSYSLEYRLAFIEPGITRMLYGKKSPLTIAISGAIGEHEVGLDDVVPTGSATPVLEYLPTWMFSGEAILPLGPLVLSGAGYAGQGAGYYGAADFQTDRLDTMTGEHELLRSWGGWGQLSLPLGRSELLGVVGEDRVYDGLGYGVDGHGGPGERSNRWIAGVVTYDLSKRLKVGEQCQYVRTEYVTGTTSYVGFVTDVRFHF